MEPTMPQSIPGQTKACRECGAVKPLLDFPIRKDQADGHHWWCFDCKRAKEREYGKTYRERNPEKKRQAARKYARKPEGKAASRAFQLWNKYRLTPETFAAKLAAQDGRCQFCPEDPGEVTWDVDHDHNCCPGSDTCGNCLRDILCHKHNIALGFFRDDPDLLRQAADYIDSWRARLVPRTGPRAKAAERGEGHQGWKGDAASPSGMQHRARNARGPASECVNREIAGCASEFYEWVLTRGTDPGDPANYRPMCKPCHRVYDDKAGCGSVNAVFTEDQVREIRRRYAAGGIGQVALAREYGVAQGVISNIVLFKTYKTVT